MKISDTYEAWRVAVIDPKDNSVQFYQNKNGSEDYRSRDEADRKAKFLNDNRNNSFLKSYYGNSFYAIVRKCRITIEEI